MRVLDLKNAYLYGRIRRALILNIKNLHMARLILFSIKCVNNFIGNRSQRTIIENIEILSMPSL